MGEGLGPAWHSLACPVATRCRARGTATPVRAVQGSALGCGGSCWSVTCLGVWAARGRVQAQASRRAQLDDLSLSSLWPFLALTHDFVLPEWQYREIKGSSRYLVLSLEVGPGYSIFYLEVCLFEFFLLKVISLICCGLSFFPQTSFYCLHCLKSQDCFLLLVF